VSASDGDGDEITYSFSKMSPSESYSQFDLHELTGVLSLKQVLDAEDSFLAGPFLLQVLPQLQTSLLAE